MKWEGGKEEYQEYHEQRNYEYGQMKSANLNKESAN